ncbi:hypothetical protein [Catellatospora tritici]|uniref:hypothetical protein n=1 Tax=Catellatospora tritici TaxID=2851566 RepID=UPI001C2DD1D5|nr:hypothetical protein [Catellatospora tritici]MBV1854877.1 hypothetical protein [Catellatospora tritici]
MYLVYRSHYHGPLSKHVRRLPDDTVLDWFRRGWHTEDPERWTEEELDDDVYGLTSIFEAAAEHDLPEPRTWEELFAQLYEHLWLEEDMPAALRFDGHALRAKTNDDEAQLAYFFVDDAAVAADPRRWAYPLHEAWPLPAHTLENPDPVFEAGALARIVALPGADGTGRTYAVVLADNDDVSGDSMRCPQPLIFPGVRLPDLARCLRQTPPQDCRDWPDQLRLLRTLTVDGEQTLRPALERANRWWRAGADALLDGTTAGQPVPDRPDRAPHRRDPEQTLIEVDEHLAQMALHADEFFGFEQWFLFDDVWADSHPELAESLLRYATHWDPRQDVGILPSPTGASTALREATARVQQVFAPYRGTDPAEAPTVEPLCAAATAPTPAALKRLLPALFRPVTTSADPAAATALYGSLDRHGARSWPPAELAAVRSFARAHWAAVLYGVLPGDPGRLLAALTRLEPDVCDYLSAWENSDDVGAMTHLAAFIDANAAAIVATEQLAEPLLHDGCPTGLRQIVAWLALGEYRRRHHDHLAAHPGDPTAPARVRIIDSWTAMHSSTWAKLAAAARTATPDGDHRDSNSA